MPPPVYDVDGKVERWSSFTTPIRTSAFVVTSVANAVVHRIGLWTRR
jgi:hypothetical protein